MTTSREIIELSIIPLGNSNPETKKNTIQLNNWLRAKKKASSMRGDFDTKLIPVQMSDEGSLNIGSELLISLAPKLLSEMIEALKHFLNVQRNVILFEFKIEQKKDNRVVTLKYNKEKLQNEKAVLNELLNYIEA